MKQSNRSITLLKPFPYAELLDWYAVNWRTYLPWREFRTEDRDLLAYRVWLSEILLQQTQADRVIPFYERMTEAFQTVHDLAQTDYETFFPYYDGLGYYSRARNLLATAKMVSQELRGHFPETQEGLLALPGVGPYTAQAIRSFAYGQECLALDTNLKKIFLRYYLGDRKAEATNDFWGAIEAGFATFVATKGGLATGATLAGTPEESFPNRRNRATSPDVNAALMDYASLVSKNAKRDIDFDAGILPGCVFFESRWTSEADVKREAKRFPRKDAELVVILHEGHRKYFSEADNTESMFRPFRIEAGDGDPRERIKAFFSSRYGIAVSVRPEHFSGYLDGKPECHFHAQIQVGSHGFATHEKKAYLDWKKSHASI